MQVESELDGDRKIITTVRLYWNTFRGKIGVLVREVDTPSQEVLDKALSFAKELGWTHHNVTLTEEDVRYVLKVYKPKDPVFGCNALAARFGVQQAAISKIVNGVTWRHIPRGESCPS